MSVYDFKKIEDKWQKIWTENGQYKTDTTDSSKPNYYTLEMFPYPSGNIHMGHVRNYSIGDVVARFKKMEGYNVLHPMGWDSFGLPAENAAIKHGVHPHKWTMANIEDMKAQLKLLGLSYDWEREVATSTPEYYRFTQEIFLKFLEAGLAYKKKSFVNWCPSCETVLANEQVVGGQCERCDAVVVKKDLEQWYFKTTAFAEELLNDLDTLDGWPEKVKTMQRNWIGKSNGAELRFDIEGTDKSMTVYTTRPDTTYGVTFMVLAPESELVQELVAGTEYEADVNAFVQKMHTKTEIERTSSDAEKEGMFIGKYVINPVNGNKIPVWIANYVLADYGTGAIMAVPAHDDRDKEFAQKYNLDIIPVIDEDNKMINSAEFNGMDASKAFDGIVEKLAKENRGKKLESSNIEENNKYIIQKGIKQESKGNTKTSSTSRVKENKEKQAQKIGETIRENTKSAVNKIGITYYAKMRLCRDKAEDIYKEAERVRKYIKKYDKLQSILECSEQNKRAKMELMLVLINEGYSNIVETEYPAEYKFINSLVEEYKKKEKTADVVKKEIDEYCL